MSDAVKVVIVGGGTAGITVAASLARRARGQNLKICIVDPAERHCYQPALTLVGAGASDLDSIYRPEAALIPKGVDWERTAVSIFYPEQNKIELSSGNNLTYDYLIVCPGLDLNWEKIKGAKDALGHDGVCSNYSPAHAVATWKNTQELKAGATVIYTQPPLPFKCPGAPQKAAYLGADHLRQQGILDQCKVMFMTHAPVIFGVPFFARELVQVAQRYGIQVNYQHNLIEVDGARKQATFEVVGGNDSGKRYSLPYDMLHITPPQSPPAVIKNSKLANEAGYVDVDQGSLRHKKYSNIFALGDACSTPNSKTAAAIRKQSPVVVANLLAMIRGEQPGSVYDGYASCPLTTAYNKVIMAEFCYGGKVTPTFPLDPRRERWINWFIKTTGLPFFYWHYMLRGHEIFPGHNTAYVEPAG